MVLGVGNGPPIDMENQNYYFVDRVLVLMS